MKTQELDYILIPFGLFVMVAYHIWLLHRVVRHPAKTVSGTNAINRRFWVHAMMQDPAKNGVLAVQTLRNNIMASSLLASTAIMLSSVIAVLMTHSGPADHGPDIVFGGDRSELNRSIKFFTILICFLLAFLLNLQSIRYYSHASILINVPVTGRRAAAEYVGRAVNRGGYFWSLGLRAFYFSLPLFFWVFGPIPMLVCCVILVSMLYFLDVNSDEAGIEQMAVGHEEC